MNLAAQIQTGLLGLEILKQGIPEIFIRLGAAFQFATDADPNVILEQLLYSTFNVLKTFNLSIVKSEMEAQIY